jgi:hypothetical protein
MMYDWVGKCGFIYTGPGSGRTVAEPMGKENLFHLTHGESLKSRILEWFLKKHGRKAQAEFM